MVDFSLVSNLILCLNPDNMYIHTLSSVLHTLICFLLEIIIKITIVITIITVATPSP